MGFGNLVQIIDMMHILIFYFKPFIYRLNKDLIEIRLASDILYNKLEEAFKLKDFDDFDDPDRNINGIIEEINYLMRDI